MPTAQTANQSTTNTGAALGRNLQSTPKVSADLKNRNYTPPPQEQPLHNKVEEPLVIQNQAFSKEVFEQNWKKFAEQQKAQGNELAYSILNKPIEWLNATSVAVQLHNLAVEQHTWDKTRFELLEFLRRELRNSAIQIQTKTVKEEAQTTRKPYTPREKFEYMKQQNPALQRLKDELGLDFDF